MIAVSTVSEVAAGDGRLDQAAGVIAAALDRLPVAGYLCPAPPQRRRTLAAYVAMYAGHAAAGAGQVTVAHDDHDHVIGAAVWLDRTRPFTEPPDYLNRLEALAGLHLDRLKLLDAVLEAHQPSRAHWHLAFIAVDHRYRGMGIGSALITAVLPALHADGIPAYALTTATYAGMPPQTSAFLRQNGFISRSCFTVVADGPRPCPPGGVRFAGWWNPPPGP